MELNREQIIKVLECCEYRNCQKCVMLCRGRPIEDDCRLDAIHNALTLIKELTEDNEDLNKTISNLLETIKDIKADTVRKMQARIEERSSWFVTQSNGIVTNRTYQLTEDALEQIVKEILESKCE